MQLSPVEDLIEAIKKGEMIILMDDEDRENEGDLVMAAEKVEAAHINFMTKYARGLVCLSLSKQRCTQLKLPLMVPSSNQSKFGTNFTLSIEAKEGVTTGISAFDRAKTIHAAVSADAKPEDVVQPGHIFPIMAHPGGVLARSGHTEASSDLALMAGFEGAGVICEIMDEDGSMARREQLEQFAKIHNLKIGTVADVIRYRFSKQSTIEAQDKGILKTAFGDFHVHNFTDTIDGSAHIALSYGQIEATISSPCWVHSQDAIMDLPGIEAQDHNRWPLSKAMQYIAKQGKGAIVLLKGHGSLSDSFNSYQNPQHDRKANEKWRLIGTGSQILAHLGYGKINVLGSKLKLQGLSGFGLTVGDYLPYTDCEQIIMKEELCEI